MDLTSNERSLRTILNSNFFFIPRFQRPYSWSPENVEELWEDAVQESSGEYFIGSMVVYPETDDTMAVIDGQQRLTTLMMLLCALRAAATEQGDEGLANGTHGFIERKDENDQERFVLTTETSYPYLQDEILSREEAELDAELGREEEEIAAAYARVREFVAGVVTTVTDDPTLAKERKSNEIKRRLKTVRDKLLNLRLIFIEVGDRDDATTIFVTLNSRGKDLEPADLVKAHLLNLLPKKSGLDRPLEQWQSIIDKFDQSQAEIKMTDFLLAVWRSRYENTTAAKLHRAVRQRVKKNNASGFLKQLIADAELFRQVSEPEYRKWATEEEVAAESLRFFRDHGIRQPMPLLLSLMREFDGKRISLKQLRRAFRAIEDYHFTYNVLANKSSSGGVSMFYTKRARDLLNANDANERKREIDNLVKELRGKRPTNAEFDEAFGDLWLTDGVTADKKVVQYVLQRFYRHAKRSTAVDFSKMTIEHLAPQSGGSSHAGRLGNLIYVTEKLNSDLANKSFSAKLERFKKVKDEWIPEDVLQATSWGVKPVAKRTRALAELGRTQVWRG